MPRRGESIYKRKDGRWEARYIHHYEDGKAKYRFLYGASYTEVKAKRLEEQAQPQNVVAFGPQRLITFEKLAALWLCEIERSVKESTYTRYHRAVVRYLLPKLGEIPVAKLDIAALKRFSRELETHGGMKGAALSAKTVSDILCVLKCILKYGEQQNYPCPNTDQLSAPIRKRHATMILTAENRRSMEEELWHADDFVSLGILFTLYTGVRIGELCGLRWGDIDLQAGTAAIHRTVERIANLDLGAKTKTKIIISEPKTQHSARVIPIPSRLCDYLAPMTRPADCYLLTGTPQYTEPHQYYLRYKTFMRSHGMDQYTFHALRHTFATRCVECGFDAKSLSEILGHANVTTTMAIYVHPTLEQKREQMERLTV